MKFTDTLAKFTIKVKKHSPEILIFAGIAGMAATVVTACIATTKAENILTEAENRRAEVRMLLEDKREDYTEDDGKKDKTIICVQTCAKLVALYAPAAVLGAMSTVSILSGYNIIKKRNAALAAAYTAVDKGFREYRRRVAEKLGEEEEKSLRYNIRAEEIIKTSEENTTLAESTVNTVETEIGHSPYAALFDEGSPCWEKNADYNLHFLRMEQNYANDRLKARGYLFLNEVYERLGIPATKAGQIVGWVYDLNNPQSDNYVDFGIYNDDDAHRLFINGDERSVLLDFNVQGNILDLI